LTDIPTSQSQAKCTCRVSGGAVRQKGEDVLVVQVEAADQDVFDCLSALCLVREGDGIGLLNDLEFGIFRKGAQHQERSIAVLGKDIGARCICRRQHPHLAGCAATVIASPPRFSASAPR
jgi:hypothetical protein